MNSAYTHYLRNGEFSPSTISPWRSEGVTGVANRDGNTASQDAPRPSMESTAQSLAPSISTSNLGRRGSSAYYSPQSLNASPHATIPEPPPYMASPQTAMSHSTSISSPITAQTISSISPSATERQPSLHSTIGSSEPSILAVANVDAMRSASIMPQHPGADSVPMSALYNPTPSPTAIVSEDEGDADNSPPHHTSTHLECYSRKDVYVKRWSWLYATLIILSLYSTVFSSIWLIASIVKPRYGRGISTGKGWHTIEPSTATLLATLGAKTIELSFVTVFVAVLGQVLTRRAFSRLSRGVTLAEMTMRNWVIQPGSLLTHWDGIPVAATTFLGALTLSASFCALFYTTASDAMVSPKQLLNRWETRDMQGPVLVSYGNPIYVRRTCQTPLNDTDPDNASLSCLDVLFSGKSYNGLTTFLSEWQDVQNSQTSNMDRLSNRPTGKQNLYDNTTMDSQWIEIEHGDVAANFDIHKRIINNVTLAMPHAGVYAAATDPINGILQPSDLSGVGEYSIKASVASPVVNVMCVNMTEDELSPLVYTQFPNARKNRTGWRDQEKPVSDKWQDDLPLTIPTEWFNRTVVDDIFKWGEKYGRHSPIFPLYPIDYNMVTFKRPEWADAMYLLARSTQDYTVCEFRSWMTPSCSSTFKLSGTSGGHMKAHCEDPDDKNAFERTVPVGTKLAPTAQGDWIEMVNQWQLAINLNGGITNNNASNARILTQLALEKPELSGDRPSMAEALAVLATSTLVTGSINSTFQLEYDHGGESLILPDIIYETFKAEVQTTQYASAYTASWQVIFYPILFLVFILNVLCLFYLAFGTSFTSLATAEPSFRKGQSSSSPSSPALPFPISFSRTKTHRQFRTSSCERDSLNIVDDNTYDNTYNEAHTGPATSSGRDKAAKGLVTDYTEPQNLFALAVNSPPSHALAGSCGHGPEGKEMRVPFRVGYSAGANHYFFEEGARPENERTAAAAMASGADLLGVDGHDGPYGKNYKRLSSTRPWL